MNHLKHLRSLLNKYLKMGIKTGTQAELFYGYMGNWIPESEAKNIFAEKGLNFSGD
jgi:hypothetical protein